MHRLLVLALVGCGSSSPPPPAPVGPPAALVATPRDGSDAIVAHVNGRPVFASCVAAQGKAHALAARAALDECIAFELMAQEAERRGLDRDHEVVLATKTALVSRLVATTYEDGLDPNTLGDVWPKFLVKYDWHVKHEEFRGSTYVRIPLPDKSPPDVDASAHALADQIAAAAAPERGMLSLHFRAIAERFTPPLVKCKSDTTVPCYDDVDPFREGGLEEHYGPALFAVREIGRTSATSVRTKWGWDVILWTENVPATDPSQAEVTDQMLPEFKQWYFGTWVRQIEKQLGVHVELDPNVQTLLGSQP
jgi:hypothetical protein